MRLDTSQHMRLEQRMKLAPRMIQAMEILQLPMMALQERIEAELVSNPVLEVATDQEPPADHAEPAEYADDRALVVRDEPSQAEDFSRLDAFQAEYEPDVWNGDRAGPRRNSGERDGKMDAMANTAGRGQSLYDYLIEQWHFLDADDAVRQAGELIIARLDGDGYLREPLEELPAQAPVPLTGQDFRDALALVQQLDPLGVGARNLRECLLIQLQALARAGEEVALEIELVRSFLRDIEMNRLPQIARKTGRSVDRIKAGIERLSHLNPRPGRLIGDEPARLVMPDLVVELDERGEPIVELTDDRTPQLHISRNYSRMARGGEVDGQTREFLQRNIRSAQWLISAIEQRRHTIRRVAEEVFRVQRDFFERGEVALRPLPMADVAEKVGVHVATVSRAVAGKYVQTPRGIFPLRMFFSGGTTTAGGADMAWDAVRAKLQEIIDAEDKARPLNDDELVEQLTARGIDIARRTVAKYRKLMDIPPARQRRQY